MIKELLKTPNLKILIISMATSLLLTFIIFQYIVVDKGYKSVSALTYGITVLTNYDKSLDIKAVYFYIIFSIIIYLIIMASRYYILKSKSSK